DARRIAAVGADVAERPGDGGAALARDLVDRHFRAKRVVDDDRRDAERDRAESDEAVVAGGESAPVAAVDEDEHGRVGPVGGKDVELLVARRAVRDAAA